MTLDEMGQTLFRFFEQYLSLSTAFPASYLLSLFMGYVYSYSIKSRLVKDTYRSTEHPWPCTSGRQSSV